jgi:ankyrin repeat protein
VLLTTETIDLDIQNHSGETPFSLALKKNKTKMIRVLLPLTKLDVQEHLGRKILHWAAEQNAPYALAALLNRTPTSVQDVNGDTPLTLALKTMKRHC